MKDDSMGFIIILGIVAIALFGGSKGAGVNGLFSSGQMTPEQKQANIQQQLTQAQYKADELKRQIDAEEEKKNASQYKGLVDLSYVNRSTDPKQEYVAIQLNYSSKESVPVTGWTLKSTSSGNSVIIPKGTYLFFTGTINSEENIYLSPGDTLYLISGISPNGASFKTNKCSGYLTQFQTFVPYISNTCPRPRDENLSSIPKTPVNDACLDYIDSFPSCRIQTESLPVNWNYECTNFIYTKINYPSCVNTHKGDKDFYGNEWRVYLKRSANIWKERREEIILYDNLGKVVDKLTY